jgi:hypothetical protein
MPLYSFHPLRPVRSIHLDLTSVLSAFPAMLTCHTVSSIQSAELTATVRPIIGLSIHLAILSPIGLPIFTSILPPIHLSILASILASVKLPILATIFPTIHAAIFPSISPPIFLANVIGSLSHDLPIVAVPSLTTMVAILSPTVDRTWPAVQ